MPQPTQQSLHVDTLATSASVAFSNEPNDYVADKLFPVLPVMKQSGIIAWINQSAWFRDEARLRAPGTKSIGGGYTVDNTKKYYCDRYSFRHEVPDEVRDNADQPYDQDRLAARFVTDKLFMARELAFATNVFTTSVFDSDQTIAVVWSNYSGSSPLTEIQGWRDSLQGSLGRDPTAFVIGRQVWTQLKYHPDVVDLLKYTSPIKGPIDTGVFASMIEVENVYVGNGIYTSTKEGTAESSVSYSRIWGKNALLMYVPKNPALEEPAAGYTVVWQRVPGALQYIKRMRNEETETDIFEANSYYQQKVLSGKAGTVCASVVA